MIEVADLTYGYPGASRPAVRELNFQIGRGEIFGFLGPSGAGKSTTQKILTGLLKGYAGRVAIFEKDLAAWGPDFYERIGVSFEVPNLFLKLTALENLAYFRALYSRQTLEPDQLLEMVGLREDGKMLVAHYSKGMKNRLTVARALLHNPDILFLDEPTSGLDPVNAQRIKELVRLQKQAGKTIFLTTHNMAVADELCDRVAFLVDGQIRLIDAPRELKLQYGRPTVRVETLERGRVLAEDFSLQGLGSNPGFLSLLQHKQVQTIHTQEASLEDIFIQVTGRSLA